MRYNKLNIRQDRGRFWQVKHMGVTSLSGDRSLIINTTKTKTKQKTKQNKTKQKNINMEKKVLCVDYSYVWLTKLLNGTNILKWRLSLII